MSTKVNPTIQTKSDDLIKLMNKVIDKGLIWKIMDISNAKKTAEKYGYNLEELMYAC